MKYRLTIHEVRDVAPRDNGYTPDPELRIIVQQEFEQLNISSLMICANTVLESQKHEK